MKKVVEGVSGAGESRECDQDGRRSVLNRSLGRPSLEAREAGGDHGSR